MPEHWLVLTVRGSAADADGRIGDALFECGASAIEECSDGLRTWVPAPASITDFMTELRHRIEHAAPGTCIRIRGEVRPDEDWLASWRRGLAPRRVGDRFIVAPTWTQPDAGPGDVVLAIDPEMAFGTGEHASTRGALRLLERAPCCGLRVLDIGTGSGILAIAAARLGAFVDAIEVDPQALDNARENVLRNRVIERVRVVHAAVDDAFLDVAGPYDLIMANVLASALEPLLEGFGGALRPRGALITAGILESEATSFTATAARAGFRLDGVDIEDGWWSALFYVS